MSGGFSPANLVTQAALGFMTGGSSLILETAMRTVVSAIGQQVIGQLGQEMGLPSGVIDMAQGAFAGAMGDVQGAQQGAQNAIEDFGSATGASPSEVGEAQSAGQTLGNMMLDGIRQAANDSDDGNGVKGSAGQGGSLLMKIAIALGQLMDKKMTDMANLTDQIGALGSGSGNQSKLGELTGKLQGLSQETSLLSNALTNTIKTIGESNSTLARKS
jgi:hypothetical protein